MTTSWEIPACAICGNLNFARHHTKNGFRIVRCVDDGLLFVSPRPSDVSPYYAESYYEGGESGTYESYELHADTMSPTWTDRLTGLEQRIGRKGRLLDVGAATGRFVQLAEKSGWTATGVELSEWAVSRGRQHSGVDLRTGSLPHPDFQPSSFDAITMFDVIEHLSDPRGVLKNAASILKPGGMIVLSTGAVPHLDPRAISSWYYPPWHLYYFSTDTVTALLEQCGFKVRDIEMESPDTPYALMTVWAEAVR